MASFDDKVDALKRLCERRKARKAADGGQVVSDEPASEIAAPQNAREEHGVEDESAALAEQTDNTATALAQLAATAAAAAADEEESAMDEADALFCLGHCHEHGIHDCDKDQVKAVEYYQLAAEKGNVVAQWRMGEMYEYGRGVDASDQQAIQWYRRAAEAGHAQAQSSLALFLEEGRGVPASDDVEALQWHLAAAAQAQALSQYCAACCLLEGRGAARDEAAAQHWLELSAAAGFPPAREALQERRCRTHQAEEGDVCDGADCHSSLLTLATRVASELQHLDDAEAEVLLDELMAGLNSSVEDELPEMSLVQRAGGCAAEVQHLVASPTVQSAPAA